MMLLHSFCIVVSISTKYDTPFIAITAVFLFQEKPLPRSVYFNKQGNSNYNLNFVVCILSSWDYP